MIPPVPEQRWLAYHYTKLGRWTYFGQWTPHITRAEMTCIPLHKTWQINLLWPMDPPHYQSRYDLHTTTQNLADEPTLAEHNDKGLKALAFTISEIPHSISQNTFLLRKCLSFVPTAPEISTSKFLGVLNTMAKVSEILHCVSENMF